MGSGLFTSSAFADYSIYSGKAYDYNTGYVTNQTFMREQLVTEMNPYNVMRECVNTPEHPKTIPVILALDVTGSMGAACTETAQALGMIMSDLYKDFKDIEFLVMGIGDMECDRAPVQVSQFESDVRIAKWLDDIYMEHGGGGNRYESYSAAWYFGLHHTKLDAVTNDGRKGIIITMGDEPLNPILPAHKVSSVFGDRLQADVLSNNLYKEAIKKFDIFHIAIDDSSSSFNLYERDIKRSFGELLQDRLKVSKINNLSTTIADCIRESVNTEYINMDFDNSSVTSTEAISHAGTVLNENGNITW